LIGVVVVVVVVAPDSTLSISCASTTKCLLYPCLENTELVGFNPLQFIFLFY
jgi:hypothetical protein